MHELHQSLTGCVLGIAEILWIRRGEKTNDGFIQQFVDQREVSTNGFFGQHSAVILDDLEETIQDLDTQGRRHVHLEGNSEMHENLSGDHKIQTISSLVNIGNRSVNLQVKRYVLPYKHRRAVSVLPRTHYTQELLARIDGSIKAD